MNGLTKPGAAWSLGLGLWCRLWQAQINASLTFYAAWAAHLPRPDAKALSEQAERHADPTVIRVRNQRRAAPRAPLIAAPMGEAQSVQTLH